MPLGIEFNDSQKKSGTKILKFVRKCVTEITCDQHQESEFVNNFVNGNKSWI